MSLFKFVFRIIKTARGESIRICSDRQFVRVVKESDLKSDGLARTGSNPVADVIFFIF